MLPDKVVLLSYSGCFPFFFLTDNLPDFLFFLLEHPVDSFSMAFETTPQMIP